MELKETTGVHSILWYWKVEKTMESYKRPFLIIAMDLDPVGMLNKQ